MNKSPLTFRLELDDKGFHAWCPELSGCHSHGETKIKAIHNLKDAISLYLEDLAEEELLSVEVGESKKLTKV